MPDILLLTVPALTDDELRNAIADTQAQLAEPLADDERDIELDRLRRLFADCRRRGIDA
jgi:hypothetical protein